MSQEEAAAGAAKPADEAAQDGEQKKQEEATEAQEQPRQEAWAARRDLIAHAPDFVSTLVNRDQFGQTGGTHYGNQIFHIGGGAETPRTVSGGPIPQTDVEELEAVFQDCPSFDDALARLRTDRIVFLSGGHETGRRSAALMLLHRLGTDRMLSLGHPESFEILPDQLDASTGHILCNLAISRSRPLREPHLLALSEQLKRSSAYLVITVEPSAAVGDISCIRWEPPPAEEMLHAHVARITGETVWPQLCGLTPVKEFLTRQHRPDDIKQFAQRLIAFHRGETDEEDLAAHGETAVANQISRWLTEAKPELRDKAFLISLAVFDKAPYAVTAELSDGLFVRLQKIEDPAVPPRIPVFGSSRDERLRLARAKGYATTEVTEWGPLKGKYCAAFRDERTARLLLAEVWNLHPSARPALADWIRKLAEDRRPLVRTRAASAAALLATADLSSALGHLIEPWADARSSHSWLTAANALTMAQLLDVPTVFPILRDWCTGENESRRWTAVRAYGLLGPVHHQEILEALLDAIPRQSPVQDSPEGEDEEIPEEARQFADALKLLLLAVREPVLAELVKRLNTNHAAHAYALLAFREACHQSKDDGSGRPLVLDWYAHADTATAQHLVLFWEALLGDRAHNTQALDILRGWVLKADADPESEAALALLLCALVTEPTNHLRVSHLLETTRDSEGARPPVAQRLLRRLSPT
ncbi:hypothetical protein [Streptomyces phaeochromogenes]|uniref:hypothetical protein n=1 Tax=Streptomyces phaeochromogenes TaxID=1923 RepID=UPI002DD8F305|nr:hypothetical protein [Streptomyces phaeochromogenes]WRZ31737.1 hypothetical protein OG931_30365 [Streptomyces phaeochromogenes]